MRPSCVRSNTAPHASSSRTRAGASFAGFLLDASAVTGVIRMQPTRVFGFAAGGPSGGTLTLDLDRVELRDESTFTWSSSGTTSPDPTREIAYHLLPGHNLETQSIQRCRQTLDATVPDHTARHTTGSGYLLLAGGAEVEVTGMDVGLQR